MACLLLENYACNSFYLQQFMLCAITCQKSQVTLTDFVVDQLVSFSCYTEAMPVLGITVYQIFVPVLAANSEYHYPVFDTSCPLCCVYLNNFKLLLCCSALTQKLGFILVSCSWQCHAGFPVISFVLLLYEFRECLPCVGSLMS